MNLFFSRSRNMHARLSPRPNMQDIRAWAQSSNDTGFFLLRLFDELIYKNYIILRSQLSINPE